MKIVSVILLAIWALIAVKPAAANLFVVTPALWSKFSTQRATAADTGFKAARQTEVAQVGPHLSAATIPPAWPSETRVRAGLQARTIVI